MPRPGFNFLVCPDAELVKRREAALMAEHPPADGAWERHVFWADEGLGARFWETLTLQSLMGASRALVVRNAQSLNPSDWDKLSAPLARSNGQAWPFFCLEGPFERRGPKLPKALTKQKFWEFAQKRGWVWQSAGLTEQGILEMVRAWASARSLAMAPGAPEALAAVLPADASAIARELDKVALAVEPGAELLPDHAALVSFTPDMDIFAFLGALEKGAAPVDVWRKVLDSQLSSDDMIFPFLANLARETRIMWRLLAGDASDVRLPPFVIQAKTATARRLGWAGLARMWELMLAADLGIKSGERTPEQSLELLVGGLAGIFGHGAGAPGRR
ncbi:MAG: DNA polymerase III subunit delta [Desulfovibrionaceae bacterium]|jgi:DNA polymerase-3 subunit delta|nr:DNA polymerase III subunit delta [Desulfovibrionaceae bacterium]